MDDGTLHIEMMYICVTGDWLDSNGWTEIYKWSGLNTAGRINSFVKGGFIKRSRYVHKVTLAAVSKLSHDTFDKSNYSDYI